MFDIISIKVLMESSLSCNFVVGPSYVRDFFVIRSIPAYHLFLFDYLLMYAFMQHPECVTCVILLLMNFDLQIAIPSYQLDSTASASFMYLDSLTSSLSFYSAA